MQTQDADHFADMEHMQTVCMLIAEILPFDIDPTEAPEGQGSAASKKPAPGDAPAAPHDQPEQLELLAAP